MKTFEELLNLQEPRWAVVQGWLGEATNPVEVLPPVEASRQSALVAIQITTRSPLGAIIYETGGILVDYGWIRLLGSGCERLPRSLPEWNLGRTLRDYEHATSYFSLVADDVIGGFYALDGGGLGGKVVGPAEPTAAVPLLHTLDSPVSPGLHSVLSEIESSISLSVEQPADWTV